MQKAIRLTAYSRGAGCGCKIAPAVLAEILLQAQPQQSFPQLLVGNAANDDAAVWELAGGQLLISTTDFFSPVVDDAYDYGRIAAANALSDVYAMGGKPVLALAVLGWPIDVLPAALAAQVMAGAQAVCAQATVALAGGHTIDSGEPFFGLAVTGLAQTAQLKRNNTAQAGDALYLTKPLGTGLITTALKRDLAAPAELAAAIASMTQLNTVGIQLGMLAIVHALTDVTGFGLAGHLLEMCATRLDATLHFDALPLLPGAARFLAADVYSDGTMRNFKSYGNHLTLQRKEHLYLLCDPQTNGGLLIAAPSTARAALAELVGTSSLWQIGSLKAGTGHVTVIDSGTTV